MEKLKSLYLFIDWICWSSGNEKILEEFQNDLEVVLGEKFDFWYKRRETQENGIAPKNGNYLEKWKSEAGWKRYGLIVKGELCEKVAKDYFFGTGCMDLRKEINISRVDIKLKYQDVVSAEKLLPFEKVFKESLKFQEKQEAFEATQRKENPVVLHSSSKGQTISIGSRNGSVYTRLCYSIGEYYAKQLTTLFRAGDDEKLTALLLEIFLRQSRGLVSSNLINVLQPHFVKIGRSLELVNEEFKLKNQKTKLISSDENVEIFNFSQRFDIHQKEGALLNLEERVLNRTLDKGSTFLIFLAIYVLYKKKILKSLSHSDYCKKLCFWSKGLDPRTEKPVSRQTDYYEPLTLGIKELCEKVNLNHNSTSVNQIIKAIEYLHGLRLGYHENEDFRTAGTYSFYVFPTLFVKKINGLPTEITLTVSTLLFRDIIKEEFFLTTEILKDFVSFFKTRHFLRKSPTNVYHTFIETLEHLQKNKDTLEIRKYKAYPQLTHRKRRFYVSFYLVLLFFFEQEYFAQFSYNEGQKLDFSLSAKEFAVLLGPQSNEQKISLFKPESNH